MELTERQEELVQVVQSAQLDALFLLVSVTLLALIVRQISKVVSAREDWQEQRERKARRELFDRLGQTDKTELAGRIEPPIL